MASPQVIIIGAGVAGLSAAAHLCQNGMDDFLILEARSQIGGRLMVEEHNGHSLHMGAQWVHGICEENSMFQLAKKHGLLSEDMERDGEGDMHHSSFDLENLYVKGGGKIPQEFAVMAGEIHTKICLLIQNSFGSKDGGKKEKLSVDAIFQLEAAKELDKLKNELGADKFKYVETALYGCFQNILSGYSGDAAKDCSAFLFGSTRELPGGDLILPTSVVEALKAEIPKLSSQLLLGQKVTKIKWSEDHVTVISSNGLELRADFCISTLPAGVMKKYQNDIFEPLLPPRKTKAFNQVVPGAVGKYFIEWKQPWRPKNDSPIMVAWPKEDLQDLHLPEDWIKGVFEVSAEDPFGTLMLVWVVGDCARSADTLPDDQVKSDVGRLLRLFLGREDIPAPDYLYRNRWTQDEFALGTYSAASLSATHETFHRTGEPLPSEENPRLLFAGEATHPTLWSFLHGARDSGIREAQRILPRLS